MREAVRDAFILVTGAPADFLFSGWGGELTESEKAVVENRLPNGKPILQKAVAAFNRAYDRELENGGPSTATEAGILAALKEMGIDRNSFP